MIDKLPELKSRFTWDEVQAFRKPHLSRTGKRELFDSLFIGVGGGPLANHLVRRGWDLEKPEFRQQRVDEARAFACVFTYGDFHKNGMLRTEDEVEEALDVIHGVRLRRIMDALPLSGRILATLRLGLEGEGEPFTQKDLVHLSREYTSRWVVGRAERALAQRVRRLPHEITRFPNSREIERYQLEKRFSGQRI